MVFLEYDVDNAPYTRYDRWWAAYGVGGPVSLPMVMVDSGGQISNGYVNFASVYKNMVDISLARPPQAEVHGGWWRTGNKVGIYVQVKNISGFELSSVNVAALHVLIYEEAHVKTTDRFVRTTVSQPVRLMNNASASYLLESAELSGVDWAKLHVIALVDYRPWEFTGPYDMLQAEEIEQVAVPFAVWPANPAFMVEPATVADPQRTLTVVGPGFVSWTASGSAPWLTLSPASGTPATQPILTALRGSLASGLQQATLTFSTSDGLFSQQVTVSAYLGPVLRMFLGVMGR